MLCSFAWSVSSATTPCPSLRFRERVFEVKIWRAKACRRATLPVPVFLNRLDAPLCVFNLGIICPGISVDWREPPKNRVTRKTWIRKRNYSEEYNMRPAIDFSGGARMITHADEEQAFVATYFAPERRCCCRHAPF